MINWHGLSVNPGADPPSLAAAPGGSLPYEEEEEVGQSGAVAVLATVILGAGRGRSKRRRGGEDVLDSGELSAAQRVSFSRRPGVGCAPQANEHLPSRFQT